MTSEITDAMVEAGLRGWADSLINAPNEDVGARRRRCIHAIISAALAARPAPEAGSVVERLRGPLRIHTEEANEAADLIEAQTAQIASLSAKVAEVELANADLELIADENADNVRLIDKIAKLIGIPHDQELTIQDVHVWKHAVEARAERLEKALRMTVAALECRGGSLPALDFARAALQQEGESDV